MVGLQTLDLAIGVRVPASQPNKCPICSQCLTFQTTHCIQKFPVRDFTRLTVNPNRQAEAYRTTQRTILKQLFPLD